LQKVEEIGFSFHLPPQYNCLPLPSPLQIHAQREKLRMREEASGWRFGSYGTGRLWRFPVSHPTYVWHVTPKVMRRHDSFEFT
jgi:hypothetical protein